MRTRDPEAKRAALLDAGLALAEESGLSQMTIDKIASTAGVAKGTLSHHFGNRADFLVALHRRFRDRVGGPVAEAMTDLPPGRARVLVGTWAFLDGCRRLRGVVALLIEARTEPAVRAEAAGWREQFARETTADFAAMGCRLPEPAARLWAAMTTEVAAAESTADAHLPDLRTALTDYLVR